MTWRDTFAVCAVCGRTIKVRKDGMIRKHGSYTAANIAFHSGVGETHCPGSDKKPKDTVE